MGGGGGDTGDSFLASIDSMMGAPPIQKKGGKGGKDDGSNFFQGLFQALGIGNKKLTGPENAGPSAKPESIIDEPTLGDGPNARAPATPDLPNPADAAISGMGAQKAASSTTDMLQSILKVVGGLA